MTRTPSTSQAFEPPSREHLFGTDQFGRDLFVRTALGGRISIGIGFAATIAIMGVGITYGAVSGFLGGWVDNGMMRFLDALYGLPYLPFAIITLAIFGTVNFWTMVVALTIASWFTTARVMRGQIITLKENDYVRAAHAVGARWHRSSSGTCCRTPSASSSSSSSSSCPESSWARPSSPSSDSGSARRMPPGERWRRTGTPPTRRTRTSSSFPSLCIAWLILSAFFIADGLRDALDPRAKVEAV